MKDKEFSEGFLHDIADLLLACKDNNTDEVALKLYIGEHSLRIDMKFTIDEDDNISQE